MYKTFFGFHERPFKLVPDPTFFFLGSSHEEALAHLAFAIRQGEGFILIIGEVGTGKTTLCRKFLENLEETVETAYIFNPNLEPLDLLKNINDELGIPSNEDQPRVLINRLNAYLLKKKRQGHRVILLIDEAQSLSFDVLEQLRLLSNLETTRSKLIQIILVGQPELNNLLGSYKLRQLGQRVSIACRLAPLSRAEMQAYIDYRTSIASGKAATFFTPGALRVIYEFSRGFPRLVNIVCDRALLGAFTRNKKRVTRKIARMAADELRGPNDRRSLKDRFRFRWLWAVLFIACLFAVIGFLTIPKLHATGNSKGGYGHFVSSQNFIKKVKNPPPVILPLSTASLGSEIEDQRRSDGPSPLRQISPSFNRPNHDLSINTRVATKPPGSNGIRL